MAEPLSAAQFWERVLEVLRRSLTRKQFDTWFSGMRLLSLGSDRVEFGVSNNFLREWIARKYKGLLTRAVAEAAGREIPFELRITEPAAGAQGDAAAAARQDAPVDAPEDRSRSRTPAFSPPRSAPSSRGRAAPVLAGSASTAYGESDVILNPQYTFENFVPGPSNQFAYAAASAVAENPGRPGASYNPLFLHGNVGLGKTHLLQGICHRLMEERPSLKILYLSCETFTNHFVTAVSNGEIDSFRYRYRHVDVLLLDDIHFLAHRERTQEEFHHTFNTLYNANKQIILSSDSTPAEIPTLEERLVSRFKWGIVARIDPPVFETRVAIVARKARMHGVQFPDEVVNLIAENISSNIRELEGAVNKVVGMSSIGQCPITHDLAEEALRDLLPRKPVRVTIDSILRCVSSHFAVQVRDIVSKRRPKSIAYPRQICMYLARKLTQHSLEEIGGYFGGRDHTTVMYAFDKISTEVKADPEVAKLIDRLAQEIQA